MIKNLNLLRTFESAARLKSYGKAAEELFISQAAVSQQMRQLEKSISTQLFFRKNKDMLLTSEGKHLFNATQTALGVLQDGFNAISQQAEEGQLTISSTQAFTTIWLMPKLLKFNQQHPEIKIKVQSSAHFEDIKKQQIDLAIRFGITVREHTQEHLEIADLGVSRVIPVCSPALEKNNNWHSPTQLFDHWLITLDKPSPYEWISWFDVLDLKQHTNHKKWIQVASTDMAINAVLGGQGVTLAADYLVQDKLESGELIQPFEFPHPTPLHRYLVFNPKSSSIKRIEKFTDWLKQEWQ